MLLDCLGYYEDKDLHFGYSTPEFLDDMCAKLANIYRVTRFSDLPTLIYSHVFIPEKNGYGGVGKNLARAAELYNRAGEEAMGAMKGKIASKYYELAAEVEGEEEEGGEEGEVAAASKEPGKEEESTAVAEKAEERSVSEGADLLRVTTDLPIGSTPLHQSGNAVNSDERFSTPKEEGEEEDFFAGLEAAAGAMDEGKGEKDEKPNEDDDGLFDELADALGGL
jgi:hypothetical protein